MMAISKTVLELESEWVGVLRPLADQPLDDFIKELAVLELYRRRAISSGKAATLLGMQRFEFINYASRLGIPFLDMSEAELEAEIAQLQALE
jgi:predicted HTH domain antitoxin